MPRCASGLIQPSDYSHSIATIADVTTVDADGRPRHDQHPNGHPNGVVDLRGDDDMATLNLTAQDADSKCSVYAGLRDYETAQVKIYDKIILVVVAAAALFILALLLALFVAEDSAVSIATGVGTIVTGSAAGIIFSTRKTHVEERDKWVSRIADECTGPQPT